jgi:hypothetical protein
MQLQNSETVLFEGMAQLYGSINFINGDITITNMRIHFQPYTFHLRNKITEILISKIVKMDKCNTAGLVPNGVEFKVKPSEEYIFGMSNRDKVIEILQPFMKAK